MSFNLASATYQASSGFYSLNVPVAGGVSPYTYNFQAYPLSWLQIGNNINIPTIESNPGGTWAIKVIVTDALGNKLQRSLVIKISNGGDPLIGDYPYDQTFSFSSSGAVTSIPTNTAIVNPSSNIGSSSSSSGSSTLSISSPSSSSTSLGSVSNLVNSVGSSSSTAGVIALQASGTGSNVRLATSSQLDSLIAIKNSQLSQLQAIISTTQTQIQVLRNQITNYTVSITNLGIPALQNRLNTILNTLQIAYNAYNKGNIDLTPFNLNITVNLQSIANLTSQKN
jgi:hypothetical protein